MFKRHCRTEAGLCSDHFCASLASHRSVALPPLCLPVVEEVHLSVAGCVIDRQPDITVGRRAVSYSSELKLEADGGGRG